MKEKKTLLETIMIFFGLQLTPDITGLNKEDPQDDDWQYDTTNEEAE